MKAWKAESFLLLMTFIWGGTFVFTKAGLIDCSPTLYLIIRFFIALVLTFIFFGKHIPSINRRTFVHGTVLGLIFGCGFLLQTYGLTMTSVSKSAFITGITVIFTPFAFRLVVKKKVRFWSKIGVIIASVGLWLFTNPRFDAINLGDVITLISTIFWAFYITYMDIFTRDITEFRHTVQLVALQYIAATPLAVAIFLIFELGSFHISFTDNLIVSLAYNGIIASFIITFIHTSVQKYTTPVKAALIFTLEPVVASAIAYFAIGETLTGIEVFGASMLMAGVLVSELGELITITDR